MESKRENAKGMADRELMITRILNAPRELVWEVFVKPEHIKNWWGPNGFTNTIEKMEVKQGGMWEFVMHGPDGTDYKNVNRFTEVVKPERIVFEHVSHPKFITTITFTVEGKKTLLKWHMLFESKEQFEQVVKAHKADEGLKQNVEKLEKYLSDLPGGNARKELTITRIFNAPRKVVFKAWTNPQEFAKWWGPKDFTNPVCELDVRPGGKINVDMKAPDGTVHPMGGTFLEIEEPNKLVFTTTAFKGADGKAMLENLNTLTFTDFEGKTKMTLHVVVKRSEPGTETALEGMNEGWNQSIDRLDTLVRNEPIVIERTFNAPVSKVWNAITDRDEMKKWYFDLPEFKPQVGFEFSFTGGPEDRKYVHLCKITEVITGKKLAHSWRYDGYEGNSFVTWELFDEGDKTRLKLTHAGLETFPASNPDFARKNFAEGWTYIVGKSLKEFLEVV